MLLTTGLCCPTQEHGVTLCSWPREHYDQRVFLGKSFCHINKIEWRRLKSEKPGRCVRPIQRKSKGNTKENKHQGTNSAKTHQTQTHDINIWGNQVYFPWKPGSFDQPLMYYQGFLQDLRRGREVGGWGGELSCSSWPRAVKSYFTLNVRLSLMCTEECRVQSRCLTAVLGSYN